jgi:hypothetical protein
MLLTGYAAIGNWHRELVGGYIPRRGRCLATHCERGVGALTLTPTADYERLAARRIGMGYEVQIGQICAPVG